MIPLLLAALLACGGGDTEKPGEAPPSAALAPAAPPAVAPAHLGLGRAPTPDEVAAWDKDVDARGRGLPPGKGSVADGAPLYAAKCAACHGVDGEGGIGPMLVGREPATGFGEAWKGHPRTIGNWWPYATTVFDYVQRAMPQFAPGSLTPDETYALTAFLLARNGAVPDDFVADAQSLPAVKMPTRVKFERDDREATSAFR